MSTVQLQERLGVDRYNLYHHLKKLASLELIENHRDRGEHAGGERTSTLTCPNCSMQHRTCSLRCPVAPHRPSTTLASLAVDEKAGMSSSLTSKVHETKSAQHSSFDCPRSLDWPLMSLGTLFRTTRAVFQEEVMSCRKICAWNPRCRRLPSRAQSARACSPWALANSVAPFATPEFVWTTR